MTTTTPSSTTRTMGEALTSLVEKFYALQEAHAAAKESFNVAQAAAVNAGDALRKAEQELAQAKAEVSGAFWQEVDPMPLVPAPRPSDHRAVRFPAHLLVDGCIQASAISASSISSSALQVGSL